MRPLVLITLYNTLSKIQQLRGVSYYWRTNEFPDRDFNTSKQIGVIAQEVENIFPELVKTDNEGYKSMDYMSLTAVLLEAIKEQQAQIEQLKEERADLKTDVELLKAAVFGKNEVEKSQQKAMPKSFTEDK